MKIKRKLAGILSVLMVFSCVLGGTYWHVNASDVKYTVNFGSGSWNVGGTTVTAYMDVVSGGDVSGGNLSGGDLSGGNASIISQNVSGVKSISEKAVITLNGFNAETMEVRLTGAGGFNITLKVANGQTSLSARNGEALPEGTLAFSVAEKFVDDGNAGDDGSGGSSDGGDGGNGGSSDGGDGGNGGSSGDGGSDVPDKDPDGGDEDVDNFEDVTKPENNACDADLKEPSGGLVDKLLTEPEKDRLEKGEEVKVYLEVSDISAVVSGTDKNLIDGKKGSTTVGMYLDIDLMKQIGSDEPVNVTETNGAVKIELKVPNALINTNSSIDRAYQVIRIHNGVAELLSSIFDAVSGMLSFETDQFSTYAIVYADYPKAGDNGGNTNNGNNGNTGNSASSNSSTPVTTNEMDAVPSTGDDSLYIPWQLIAVMVVIVAFAFGGRKYVYKRKN